MALARCARAARQESTCHLFEQHRQRSSSTLKDNPIARHSLKLVLKVNVASLDRRRQRGSEARRGVIMATAGAQLQCTYSSLC